MRATIKIEAANGTRRVRVAASDQGLQFIVAQLRSEQPQGSSMTVTRKS